jgi:glucose/arabinose dehydrogenase
VAGAPRKIAARAALMLLALMLLGSGRAEAITLPPDFSDSFVTGANQPTSLAFVPGGRLLIGEEAGVVRVYENGALNATAALDIRARVCSDGERGLMSVAVDPQFESNHFVYVYYTFVKNGCDYDSATTPVNRVSRFVLRDDDTVDPNAETVLIDNIPAPQSYHIGADLQFGKDGLLYVSTGDGGCDYAGDSGCLEMNDASRDRHVLLGKVLRITRDGAIPAGNPWQGTGTARCNVTGRTTAGTRCQETFAWGLRNPFRLAVDPNSPTTRFFINDVGEITWEEIDLGQAGADYGWNVREGFCATGSTTDCGAPPTGMTNPIHAYSHEPSGCYAITGGAFVPKGLWSSSYDDDYLYADLVCGRIFRLAPQVGGGWAASEWATGIESPITMTFGPAPGGRYSLYYATWAGSGHQVRRITYTGADRAGYPRPKGASPLRVPLTTAFVACTAGNRTHGPPLAHPACNPPAQTSQQLTVGTPDANGQASAFIGSVRLGVHPGDPATTADEADVALVAKAVDVRRRSDLWDYTGELGLRLPLRITDRDNGGTPTSGHGTVQDAALDVPVQCTATPTAVGSTCAVSTTVDAVAPGVAREGERAVWALDRIQVFDGGADGVASTSPNTLFATQGIFVP